MATTEEYIDKAVRLGGRSAVDQIKTKIIFLPCVNDLISLKAVVEILDECREKHETVIGDKDNEN